MIARVTCLALCFAVLVSTGCARRSTSIDIVNLQSPADLAFACVKTTRSTRNDIILADELVPLERCDLHNRDEDDEDFPDDDPCFAPDSEPEVAGQEVDCELQALLTELFAGTVGGLNVTAFGNQAGDLSIRIPAVTFLRVGERPSGIAIWDQDSRYAWVSNFGTRDIQVISTKTVLNLQDSPGVEAFPPANTILPVSQGPTDIVISPTGHYLYSSLQEAGTIVEIAIDPLAEETQGSDKFLDTGTELALTGTATQVAAPPIGPTEDNDYFRYCQPEREPLTLFVDPRDPVGETADPQPIELTIDPVENVLLVADKAKPLIHRFQLGTDSETPTPAVALDPINVGVPTLDVVVTPAVPETFLAGTTPNTDATQRYLYAIDATDGSVLVVDYTEGSPTFGAVLPVYSGGTPTDRLDLGDGLATTLSVLTPDYPEDATTLDSNLFCDLGEPDDTEEATPRFLSGVFLSVGSSDGTVRIVDVFDLNATCRGGQYTPALLDCTDPFDPSDVVVSIRRNRPRIGVFVTQDLSVSGTPGIRFNQSSGGFNESTGRLDTQIAPGLNPVTCPDNWINLFGDPDPLICGNDEPWAAPSERWDAEWEEAIPFAIGVGSLETESLSGELGEWLVAEDASLCLFGVLGTLNAVGLDPSDPESGYLGDQLVITGELPPVTQQLEELMPGDCARFVDNEDDLDDNPVSFAIVEARQGELRLGNALGTGYTFQEVLDCYDGVVSFEVRTRGAYTVIGTTAGFLNRVTAADVGDPQSACTIDPARPIDVDDPSTYLNGRAFQERPYLNPFVTFEISDFPEPTPDPPPIDTRSLITFTTDNRASELQFRTGLLPSGQTVSSLPESLVYLKLDDRLYLADVAAGFAIITLQPLQFALSIN